MPSKHEGPRHVRQAWNAVSNAVRDGRIKKPTRCQSCGRKAKLQADHRDYKKPTDVRFLCLKCHSKLTKKERPKNAPKGKYRDSKRKK